MSDAFLEPASLRFAGRVLYYTNVRLEVTPIIQAGERVSYGILEAVSPDTTVGHELRIDPAPRDLIDSVLAFDGPILLEACANGPDGNVAYFVFPYTTWEPILDEDALPPTVTGLRGLAEPGPPQTIHDIEDVTLGAFTILPEHEIGAGHHSPRRRRDGEPHSLGTAGRGSSPTAPAGTTKGERQLAFACLCLAITDLCLITIIIRLLL